jgi:hypothetical protein
MLHRTVVTRTRMHTPSDATAESTATEPRAAQLVKVRSQRTAPGTGCYELFTNRYLRVANRPDES